MKQTGLANSIDASEYRARLDAAAKKLIRHKIILAYILKECVEEFSGYDVRYIEENCIVGEPEFREIAVDQDMPDADTTITGSNTEDKSEREGTVYFDLVFDACVPDTNELISLIINLEVQVELEAKDPLIARAIYYLARLISRQKGTVFTKSDYGKIKKVYSIWICLDPRKANRNSVVEYAFTQKIKYGKVDEPVRNYDKMKAIIISLNDDGVKSDSAIIRLLSTLLSVTKSSDERKRIMEEEYGIPMTHEMQEEAEDMGSLSMAYEEIGFEKGKKEGKKEGIKTAQISDVVNLMETLELTVQQAMDALKIPEKKQKKYAKKVQELQNERKQKS